MRCPFCGEADTQVKDSRPTETAAQSAAAASAAIAASALPRSSACSCANWSSLKPMAGAWRLTATSWRARSAIAMRKRPVKEERIERIVNGDRPPAGSVGETEIKSQQIGELVMETLKAVDTVAYVRFA